MLWYFVDAHHEFHYRGSIDYSHHTQCHNRDYDDYGNDFLIHLSVS